MTTKLEELLGVLCLVLVLMLKLMLAVAVVMVLVLMLCGNQIGRAASIPVFGIDVDIDVSAGAGILALVTALLLLSCAQGCKWGIAIKIPKGAVGGRQGNQSRRASLLAA